MSNQQACVYLRLVLSRVSHCELRDLEWSAVVGPAEWLSVAVVVLDEREDVVGEFVDGVELAVFEDASFEDREEELDLVEPRRVCRRVVQEYAWMGVEELFDVGCGMRGEVVDDAMQFQATRGLRDEIGEEL